MQVHTGLHNYEMAFLEHIIATLVAIPNSTAAQSLPTLKQFSNF